MSNFDAPSFENFGSTFSKCGMEHEQMMSDVLEEIDLKRDYAQLLSQFKLLPFRKREQNFVPHGGLKNPPFPPHGGLKSPNFAPLFSKVDFQKGDTSHDFTAQHRELIRILRLKRDRLKVLNPSLFMRSEFDEENEKIVSDVVEEIELKRECEPLLAQLHDITVKRKELIRILRLKRDRLKVLNPSLFAFKNPLYPSGGGKPL